MMCVPKTRSPMELTGLWIPLEGGFTVPGLSLDYGTGRNRHIGQMAHFFKLVVEHEKGRSPYRERVRTPARARYRFSDES